MYVGLDLGMRQYNKNTLICKPGLPGDFLCLKRLVCEPVMHNAYTGLYFYFYNKHQCYFIVWNRLVDFKIMKEWTIKTIKLSCMCNGNMCVCVCLYNTYCFIDNRFVTPDMIVMTD